MPDSPDDESRRITALQEELEASRQKRDTYQALLRDLPEVFEGKFRERARPLLERNAQLQEEGQALREQIRQALPVAGAAKGPLAASDSAPAAGAPAPVTAPQPPDSRPVAAPAVTGLASRGVEALGSWLGEGRRSTDLLAGVAMAAGLLVLAPRLFHPNGARPVVNRGPQPSVVNPVGSGRSGAAQSLPATLTLRTTGASWLEVRDARDRLLYSGELRGRRVFPLSRALRVRAGRADLVWVQPSGEPERRFGPLDFFSWVTFQPPAALPEARSDASSRRQP